MRRRGRGRQGAGRMEVMIPRSTAITAKGPSIGAERSPIVLKAKRRMRRLQRDAWRLSNRRYLLPEITYRQLTGQSVPHDYLAAAIKDDLCLPPIVNGRRTGHNDFDPLMGVVEALPPGIVVELGTAHGATVANMCALNAELCVYTVNAPFEPGTADFDAYGLEAGEIESRVPRSWLPESRYSDLLRHARSRSRRPRRASFGRSRDHRRGARYVPRNERLSQGCSVRAPGRSRDAA